MGSPPIDPRTFRSVLGQFCTGITVITTVHDGGDHFVVFGAVHSLSDVPRKKPRPLLFYQGQYTGIEPDKNSPADWRNDLEAFLTATTDDTWL